MTLEETLIEHCSATLAGMKVANLVRYSYENDVDTLRKIQSLRALLSERGIRISILKRFEKTSSVLLYVYREKQLENLFTDENVCKFLEKNSYCSCKDSKCYLKILTEKLKREECFPHEIGIFLGYPLRDVKGFIENRGQNYTFAGNWKAYGDSEKAKAVFEKLEKCKHTYKKMYSKGKNFEQLIVASN